MPEHPSKRIGFSALPPDVAEARRAEHASRREREALEAQQRVQGVRRYSLAIAGALFLATGMYYLLIAPGVGDTVNLQRLSMGETFTIAGAILSGFAWRPKA